MPVPRLTYSDANGEHEILLTGDQTSMGRSANQDLVLADQRVSRNHAVILRENNSFLLIDQSSRHGTFVNGRRIERAILASGDLLQMGSVQGTRLWFRAGSEAESTEVPHRSLHELMSGFDQLQDQSPRSAPQNEMQRLSWLLAATRQLNAGEAMDEVLTALLQLTLKITCLERGFVLLGDEGGLRFAQGLNAQGVPLAEDRVISRQAVKQALQSQAKFFIGDTLTHDDAHQWASVIANEIRSILCIPLRKRVAATLPPQLLGLLYLDRQFAPGSVSELDHQVLDLLATEASTLLENALLAEAERKARQAREELALAARIHSGLMSATFPTLPYAVIQAKSVPCLAIGGDFYDVAVLDDSVCAAIVDVSGKGVSAAIVAATLQGIIHALMLARQPLAEIATAVNFFLCSRDVGKYATMALFQLHADGCLEYINCGHILPRTILNGQIRTLDATNLVVGLIAGSSYASAKDALQPGERLLLATDGVTEAENATEEMFGDAGLNTIALHANLDEMLQQIARFQAPNLAQDDCTLFQLTYRAG